MSTLARRSQLTATVSSGADWSSPAPDLAPQPSELFVKGVTPPDPLKAILFVLDGMPAGRAQYVRTLQDPAELRGALGRHGVEARSAPMPDGSWRTRLIRPAPSAGAPAGRR